MNITLIYPPYSGIYGSFKPAAELVAYYPPLGLTYLVSALSRDHSVSIIDMEVEGLGVDDVKELLIKHSSAVVGVTSTTPTHHIAEELFKLVKNIDKNIITVSGGPHPTSLPKQTLKETKELDFIVCGEGEKTLPEIVNSLEGEKDFSKIEGIAWRRGGKIIVNSRRKLIENLDELEFPARNLLNNEKYLWSVPKKGIVPITTFMSSRGCPFQCVFCSQRVLFGEVMRYRSVENIIQELCEIKETYGINHIIWLDDTFGINKKRAYEVCDSIIKEDLGITWECMTRVDVITKKLLEKMKASGLVRLSFGVESGNQHILDAAKKGITLDQIRRAYDIATELDLETRMSVILGLPFETRKTVKKTIDFMKSLKAYQAYVNIGTPFPATEYYEMAKNGYGGLHLLSDDWSEYRRWGNAVIEVNDLSRDDLIRLQKRALLDFYLRPKQILYNLKRAGLKAGFKNSIGFIKSLFNLK